MNDLLVVEATDVSSFWKITQISFLIIAGVSGIISGCTQDFARERLGYKCFLGSSPKLTLSTELLAYEKALPLGENFIRIDSTESIWSSDGRCDLAEFTLVCSFIFATIWAVFFIMCGAGGRSTSGLPQPWRIIPPALIFSFITFIVVTVATVDLSNGSKQFCQKFDSEMVKFLNSTSDEPCSQLDLLLIHPGVSFVTLIQAAQLSAWLSMSFWGLATTLLVLRVFFSPDFIIVRDNRRSKKKSRTKSLSTS